MKKQLIPALTFLCCLSLSVFQLACSQSESAAFEVVDVQPEEAAEKLNKESVVVLDVRTPQEAAAGHIPGSLNINIASPDFAAQIAKLDSSKTYMVHCQKGSPGGRSRQSLKALENLGVGKVYHLEGGFMGWSDAGNEVEVATK